MTGTNQTRNRAVIGVLGLAMTSVLLAGCGGSPASSDDASPSLSPSPAATVAKGKTESFADLEQGWQGVLKDVNVQDCPTAAGEVTASGTVTNSAPDARDISILVAWLAADSSDPLLQLQQTLEKVPAGQSVNWAVTGTLPTDAGRCIVGARSGVAIAG